MGAGFPFQGDENVLKLSGDGCTALMTLETIKFCILIGDLYVNYLIYKCYKINGRPKQQQQ